MTKRGPAPCGTTAAYQRHVRRGEEPDEACREANRNYIRQRRASSPDLVAKERYETNARSRAVWRLAAEYPDRFSELCAEEMGYYTPRSRAAAR